MPLPKLSAQQPIVNPDRKPSSPFLQFMEKTRTTQEETDARQDAADAAILQLISDLEDAVAAIAAAQAAADAADAKAVAAQADADVAIIRLDAVDLLVDDVLLPQITDLSEGVYIAQATGNAAQTTADDALGGATVSGSATNPSVDLSTVGAWVLGPVVALTGVAAGDLTFTGSGPIQDADVVLTSSTSAAGQYRLVEVIGGVDTVLLTESFSVYGSGTPATVSNSGSSAVAAYLSARASTGAVDYRIDARLLSGAIITNLSLYIYARRAA